MDPFTVEIRGGTEEVDPVTVEVRGGREEVDPVIVEVRLRQGGGGPCYCGGKRVAGRRWTLS